jgi:hypothetical protein
MMYTKVYTKPKKSAGKVETVADSQTKQTPAKRKLPKKRKAQS